MGSEREGPITTILQAWRAGDPSAFERLVPIVYRELHRLAEGHLRRERGERTLQPTALVHEAYLRLVGTNDVRWQDRAHFFSVAAGVMRRILVDHARTRRAVKRGGDRVRISFDENLGGKQPAHRQVLALDDALSELSEIDARKARIIELRYYAGLSLNDTARLLDLSPATINNESRFARAWLQHRLRTP